MRFPEAQVVGLATILYSFWHAVAVAASIMKLLTQHHEASLHIILGRS